jgi:hypothetical protein
MALLPVLALMGVFGERWDSAEASNDRLRVEVAYPTRTRTRISRPLTIEVVNISDQRLASVEVEIDPAYLEHFAGVVITPAPARPYVVVLDDVAPGETRSVHVELEGDDHGRHRGWVTVRDGSGTARVPIQTTVFP